MGGINDQELRNSFLKVKDEMNSLNSQIFQLKTELYEIQNSILQIFKQLNSLNNPKITQNYPKFSSTDSSTHFSTDKTDKKTIRQINQTDNSIIKHPSTDIYQFKSLNNQNINSSTGNEGVSTDRQTYRQTDSSTGNEGVSTDKSSHNIKKLSLNQKNQLKEEIIQTSNVLSQLDDIKISLKIKIKKLTNQEMLVLSSIYQLEDQGVIVNYNLLSQNLNLTQSSIRDYVQRISLKGIPLLKEKINNKRIILHISPELRKLASLNTLISLREL